MVKLRWLWRCQNIQHVISKYTRSQDPPSIHVVRMCYVYVHQRVCVFVLTPNKPWWRRHPRIANPVCGKILGNTSSRCLLSRPWHFSPIGDDFHSSQLLHQGQPAWFICKSIEGCFPSRKCLFENPWTLWLLHFFCIQQLVCTSLKWFPYQRGVRL